MSVIDEAELVEALPSERPSPRFARAAALLEKAVSAGCRDAPVLYMLALAYKNQGKTSEAHATLRKISDPDADTVLQMGILSLRENQLARAEEELARAWQLDPSSYETAYNLLLTRLTLGQVGPAAAELVVAAIELAAGSATSSPKSASSFCCTASSATPRSTATRVSTRSCGRT